MGELSAERGIRWCRSRLPEGAEVTAALTVEREVVGHPWLSAFEHPRDGSRRWGGSPDHGESLRGGKGGR